MKAPLGLWGIRRKKAVAAATAARGWSFTDRDDSLANRFVGQPFDHDDNASCRCGIAGELGGSRFTAFEYSYETRETGYNSFDGRTETTTRRHTFWVVALEGLAEGLPVVSVSHRGLIRKVAFALSLDEFHTGDRAFDTAYTATIRGAPLEVLGRLLAAPVRAATIAGADVLGDHWRIESGALLTWFAGPTRFDRVDTVVRTLAALRATFPEDVLIPRW
jgi:hypothetical protein